MDNERTTAVLENIDWRLANVEQILPTLPTRDEMRATVQEEGERSRRYMQVLTEGLRDDIRLLAEGHLALDRRDAAQHAETTARLDTLEFRVAHPTRPRPAG